MKISEPKTLYAFSPCVYSESSGFFFQISIKLCGDKKEKKEDKGLYTKFSVSVLFYF